MEALLRLVANAKTITVGKTFVLTFSNPDLKSLLVKLNHDQLRASQLSNDTKIPFNYSQKSIDDFGKRPGAWTLFDTGDLYDSFKVTAVTEEAIIEFGDLIKEDGGGGADFEELFNGNVLGLDSESKTIFIKEALPIMQDILLRQLQK
jgi:hypothetical protein